MTSVEAAPLLCAGLTTFKALQQIESRPGALVAIQEILPLAEAPKAYERMISGQARFRMVLDMSA